MFFGVFLSPMGWLMVVVAVLFSLALPFAMIGTIVSPLPEPFRTVAQVVLGYVGIPVLLCYLHSRKVFGRGAGSVFFRLYTWTYLLVGAATTAAFYADGGFNLDIFLFGIIMIATGLVMIWWSRKTFAAFAAAIEEERRQQASLEREEDIQRQTEAIIRAEQLRNG